MNPRPHPTPSDVEPVSRISRSQSGGGLPCRTDSGGPPGDWKSRLQASEAGLRRLVARVVTSSVAFVLTYRAGELLLARFLLSSLPRPTCSVNSPVTAWGTAPGRYPELSPGLGPDAKDEDESGRTKSPSPLAGTWRTFPVSTPLARTPRRGFAAGRPVADAVASG